MPLDIFISYSSKDKAQADQLSELLASAGLSVWIDRSGIDVATSWSAEIVDAIEACHAFVILRSPNSIESKNVVKELALAAERNKKILPLDLEPVVLPRDLAYHLAGIQRAPMTNIDAILRTLGKLGLETTQPPSIRIVKEKDSRKSLMILPFEDMSPTGDNGWFADGLASELISALSNVKALHVANAQATKEFKKYSGQLTTYAHEMNIRYFIQGDVRKVGDTIKITSRLLDIESGDYLWQDSLKGTMDDIFDIQEQVAEKVVEGLQIHLAADEKKKLVERGTSNAEAYELRLKASEYFGRQTREGYRLAIQLLSEAISLDPSYVELYKSKANALAQTYRLYDRDPALLAEAESLSKTALKLKPDNFDAYYPLSQVYTLRGQLAEAEEITKEYVRKDPLNFMSHHSLGFFHWHNGRSTQAIASFEESARLYPEDVTTLWNLIAVCDSAGERDKSAYWATEALPIFELHLKLRPDDEANLVHRAVLLHLSGSIEASHQAAMDLKGLKDAISLYNVSCLLNRLGDHTESLTTFRKAIEAGLRDVRLLREFLADAREGSSDLVGTPEYEEVMRIVEKIEEDAKIRG
jgi:adenylate cyclase